MDTSSKTRLMHQNTADSESGFSDCSNMTLPNVSVSPIPADGKSTLQSYLQTWTPEDAEPANPVTIVVNGIEIKGYFSPEDALKLRAAFEGNNFGGPVATITAPKPSMPQLGDEDDRFSDEQCQNWIMQHHSGEVNPVEAAIGIEEVEDDIACFKAPSPKRKCRPKDNKVTMVEKLIPKLPCLAKEWSHVPSNPIIDIQSGKTAAKGIHSDADLPESPSSDGHYETHFFPPKEDHLSSIEETSSSDEESLPSNAERERSPMPAHQLLLDDLQLSESEEDEPPCCQPLRPPMEETTFLDGMILRINMKKVIREAAELEKLKAPKRRALSSSTTSDSMDEEDLPLLSDSKLSDSDTIMLSSDEEDESSFVKTEVNLEYYLPKREPKALDQEALIQQERAYMLEYDAWLEQRRLLYDKIVPGVADTMPTNMQPVVRLERIAFIDDMALNLVNTKEQQNCPNSSFSSSGSSQSKRSDLSSNIVSFEELKKVAIDEGEPSLCSLLENLDELHFKSSSGDSNTSLEFPNVAAIAENLFVNSCLQSPSEKQDCIQSVIAVCQTEKEAIFGFNEELLHSAQEVQTPSDEQVHNIVRNEIDATISKIQEDAQMMPDDQTLPPKELELMRDIPQETECGLILPDYQPPLETASTLFNKNKLPSVSGFLQKFVECIEENGTVVTQEQPREKVIRKELSATLSCQDLSPCATIVPVMCDNGENITEEQPDSEIHEAQPVLVPDHQEPYMENEFDSQSEDEEDDCLHLDLSENEEEFI